MRQRNSWSFLALVTTLYNVTAVAQSSLDSPEKLRDAFLAARKSRDVEAAMNLFCPAETGKWVVDMYREAVASAVNLPLVSATLEMLPPGEKPTIIHSVEPLGRLVFVFDNSKQKGFAVSSSLYFGRAASGYCLALPIAPERP